MFENPGSSNWSRALSEATSRRYWMLGTVLFLGIASITMLIGTNRIRESLMIQDVALVRAVGEIQTCEAISHLWIEEYVTGDEVHLEEAWESQDRATSLIGAILEGGYVAGGRYLLDPVEDPDLRRMALEIQSQVEDFRRIALARQAGYESGESVGIGSAIDVEYDEVFKSMLGNLRDLENVVEERLNQAHDRSSLLFRTILIAWIAIVALAVTGLWTRERRRLLAETALRESEAQLLHSQKMESLGRLAGGLAHDINNYLAAIISQCELIKLRSLDKLERGRRLDSVIATASKAGDLIRRLLAFSRRETVKKEVICINHIVKDVNGMLRRVIGDDVQLATDLADDLWPNKIDPSQVEQTIVNLVINSREAMPTGGLVTIRTANHRSDGNPAEGRPRMEPGEYVMLAVTDTGMGIADEIRDRIFEPFATTKDKATSSGLGLATVHGIVKQNAGSIHVETEVGQGTTLSIYFPRSRGKVSKVSTQRIQSTSGGTQKILLIEDNHELRVTTREALELRGYSVVAVSDGPAALKAFDDGIDIVITDVVMPGMNGREVLEQLRSNGAEVPAIFVSGYTDDVILRHGIKHSEVNFLPKPFRVDDLVGMIKVVLEKHDRVKGDAVDPEEVKPLVLIIENDLLLRSSLGALLEEGGFQVEAAKDGEEGVDLFRKHASAVKCVLLDLNLPRMSGEEALQVIRRTEASVPVLIMSGLSRREIESRVTMDEITWSVLKPFDAESLLLSLLETTRTGIIPRSGEPQEI